MTAPQADGVSRRIDPSTTSANAWRQHVDAVNNRDELLDDLFELLEQRPGMVDALALVSRVQERAGFADEMASETVTVLQAWVGHLRGGVPAEPVQPQAGGRHA